MYYNKRHGTWQPDVQEQIQNSCAVW